MIIALHTYLLPQLTYRRYHPHSPESLLGQDSTTLTAVADICVLNFFLATPIGSHGRTIYAYSRMEYRL